MQAMSLVDKYRVRHPCDVAFHHDIYHNLVVSYNCFFQGILDGSRIAEAKARTYQGLPNLLVYGPEGSGRHSVIQYLLRDIYGPAVDETFAETYTVHGYGNSSTLVTLQQSRYHIVIDAHNNALDKYIIQEIVKEYARQMIVNSFVNRYPFRVVVINNIDQLNYYAQTSLRCTMERFYKTCRFIVCGSQLGRIIDPIRSRCLSIRVPLPSRLKLFHWLSCIVTNEQLQNIGSRAVSEIVHKSGGNLRYALWLLTLKAAGCQYIRVGCETNVVRLLDHLVDKAFNAPTDAIRGIRDVLYGAYTTVVEYPNILQTVVRQIAVHPRIPESIKMTVVSAAANLDIRLFRGKRGIIHVETLLALLVKLLVAHHSSSTCDVSASRPSTIKASSVVPSIPAPLTGPE